MSLSDKYGIPEEKIKLLIKDGWISCSAINYEEIYVYYKAEISKGVPSKQAVHNASVKGHVSERWVYTIIEKFK